LTWGGASCALAMPPVTTQLLRFAVGTTVIGSLTDTGHKVDGTEAEPCRALEEQFPQTLKNVPFGFGTLTAIGLTASGSAAFRKDIDVFVGAGISNPTITFDVPMDAGVDAAPPADAAPADAPPVDAPVVDASAAD
jgi:hypothetical protein